MIHVSDRPLYLLEHAGSELHSLMVLLLQHVHVQIIQEIISVIFHPTVIKLHSRRQTGRAVNLSLI